MFRALSTAASVNRYPQTINWRNVRCIIGGLSHVVISKEPEVRALSLAFHKCLNLSVDRETLMQDQPISKKIEGILQQPTTRLLLGRYSTDNDAHAVLSQYERNLIDHYNAFAISYLPNTEEAIRTFYRRGIQFGCTTGDLSPHIIHHLTQKFPLWKPWPIVAKFPRPGGIYRVLDHWNANAGGPMLHKRRIEMHEVVKVGESMSDLEEAHAAGIPFVAIIGHHCTAMGWSNAQKRDREHEFRLAGAARVFDTLDDFLSCLET